MYLYVQVHVKCYILEIYSIEIYCNSIAQKQTWKVSIISRFLIKQSKIKQKLDFHFEQVHKRKYKTYCYW